MIYFKPSNSGLNSMLGQLMWFKRFCDGCGIDFGFALDLDESPRNQSEGGLHRLFFGEELRVNLNRNFDERIGLHEFFHRARKGASLTPEGNLLVDASIGDSPWSHNVWMLPEFQLYCLEKGFLSDVFPYWAAPLDAWTRCGALAEALTTPPASRPSTHCLIHSRIGDCCVVQEDAAPRALGALFPRPVFAAQQFMSQADFQRYRFGLHPKFPARHYAERGARLITAEAFANAAATLKQSADKPVAFHFVSDAYTKPAEAIAKATDGDAAEIESALNETLAPVTNLCEKSLIGETSALLEPTLQAIMDCDVLITGPSLFAFTVKLAIQGERALSQWRMLDNTDTLSQYLQLPCLVDTPLSLYEARLEQLINAPL